MKILALNGMLEIRQHRNTIEQAMMEQRQRVQR